MLQKWENISFLILITLFSIFRADTLYRLCYASILIHWRSYMMYYRESLFQSLFSFDMVTIWPRLLSQSSCVLPRSAWSWCTPSACSLLAAGSTRLLLSLSGEKDNTSLLYIQEKQAVNSAKPMFDPSRYWFVKSSLQTEVMETFKRDQFVFKVLLLPQVIVR